MYRKVAMMLLLRVPGGGHVRTMLAVLTFVVVAGIAAEVNLITLQQDATPPSPSTPSNAASSHSITLTGCVYQASDDQTLFAFQRISTGSYGSANLAIGTFGGGPGTAGVTKTSGWYRLWKNAVQDLRQFTGRRVSLKGTVIQDRDVDGAEVVIHEILPDEVQVRAFDLRPAPELKIDTITAAQGSCNQPVSAR
jgi:hypothetical protein